jgi:hypothetical protein
MPNLMPHPRPTDLERRWPINGLQRLVLTRGDENPHHIWLDIVENFLRRDLTIAQDALAAVAGIANSMARVYGMDYLARLWKQYIGNEFPWRVVQNEEPLLQDIGENGHPEKIAPSWSWASVSRKVKWTGDRGPSVKQKILIYVVDTKRFDSALSSVGSITLRGRARKHKRYPSKYYPDCPNKSTPLQAPVLVIFVDKIEPKYHNFSHYPTIFTCLVLVPSELDGAWQKVGLAEEKISEREYPSLQAVDITIV